MNMDNKFLLENLQGGVVYSDFEPPFHLRYCTEGMAEMSGYSVEELMNMCQMDLVYEQDIDPLSAEVMRQFALGDTFSVEYRLKRKDGRLVHVLDNAKAVLHEDEKKYIHCLLTDISDFKKMEKALWLSQEKYKLALKESGNVILEFDLSTNNLFFSENYENVFNGTAPTGNICALAKSNWLEAAYVDDFLQLFDTVIKNQSTESTELKILQTTGQSVWGILHLTPVSNIRGETYAIVGCLKNIDKEKQQIEHLTELSEKDGLTGVYNRVCTEEIVNAFIKSYKNKGALLILDIDHFKQINDSSGHAFGDQVLKNLVGVVKSAIPNDAVLGRLGGDEFLIFVPELHSRGGLVAIAKNIVAAMAEANKEKIFLTPTTLSVGAAMVDDSINNFNRLYKSADVALYKTKENGRNGYTIL